MKSIALVEIEIEWASITSLSIIKFTVNTLFCNQSLNHKEGEHQVQLLFNRKMREYKLGDIIVFIFISMSYMIGNYSFQETFNFIYESLNFCMYSLKTNTWILDIIN